MKFHQAEVNTVAKFIRLDGQKTFLPAPIIEQVRTMMNPSHWIIVFFTMERNMILLSFFVLNFVVYDVFTLLLDSMFRIQQTLL